MNKRQEVIQKYTQSFGSLLSALPGFTAPATPAQLARQTFSTPAYAGPGSGSGAAAGKPFSMGAALPFSASMANPFASTSTATAYGASSGYTLQVLFYFFLYGFVLFLLLMLIHYAVRPIFQFVPGGSGIIPMSTSHDYKTYWNSGSQELSVAPDSSLISDILSQHDFVENYTVSVDIYLTDLTNKSFMDRLIFYNSVLPLVKNYSKSKPTLAEDISANTDAQGTTMICYIDDSTNNLLVTYFLNDTSAQPATKVQRSCFPIQNIPLYTPFRLTIVYNKNIFTVYLNGVQVSQTNVAHTLPRISSSSTNGKHRFYPNTSTTKCGNVQTLMLWNRGITYPEIVGNTVALTGVKKFGIVSDSSPTQEKCT